LERNREKNVLARNEETKGYMNNFLIIKSKKQ